MMETLEAIDRSIVLFINGLHTPFLDEFMWWVSSRILWVPLYLLLIYLGYRQLHRKELLIYVGCVILAVILADQISVHLFKDVFLRYRPSHNLLLVDQLHFYQLTNGEFYKGGMYGFISSHAANFFAIVGTSVLVLKKSNTKFKISLFAIAALVAFSRVYLGVHYFSDVFVGALVGMAIAWFVYKAIFLPLSNKIRVQ